MLSKLRISLTMRIEVEGQCLANSESVSNAHWWRLLTDSYSFSFLSIDCVWLENSYSFLSIHYVMVRASCENSYSLLSMNCVWLENS